MLPQDFFSDLNISRTRFDIKYDKGKKPEIFTGSAWRGILGSGLQKTLCPFTLKKGRGCVEGCLSQDSCPYMMLFRKQSSLPGRHNAPKGYTLYSLPDARNGQELLNVTLFGDCRQFLLPVSEILRRAGQQGLTRRRCRFEIVEEETLRPFHADLSKSSFPLAEWISSDGLTSDRVFAFHYPVRLARKDKKTKVKKILRRMDWTFFFLSAVRKLDDLHCIYNGGTPLDLETIKRLESMFQGWDNITDTLTWKELWRRSGPQDQKIPLGGLVGNVRVKRCTPVQYAWLQAAGLVGVGKARVMGLGRIIEQTKAKQDIPNNKGGRKWQDQ